MKQLEKWAVLPDMQIKSDRSGRATGVDLKSLNAVLSCLADNSWDGLVILGDFLDFNCISSHNNGFPRLIEGQSLAKDYKIGNKILDQVVNAVRKNNKKCRIVFLEGNHEYRVERLIDANPTLEGIIEVPEGLHFKARNIEWIPCYKDNTDFNYKKLTFTHGVYTNDLHAKSHVTKFGHSVVYGHLHDFQAYTFPRRGKSDNIIGVSMMCLCTSQEWEKTPNRWQQGFGVVYFWGDGYFQIQPILINKHRFVFNNKEY